MVNIVLISHSKILADGTRELAAQMGGQVVEIATAAGIDDPANSIGTNPEQIVAAIRSVYSADGVVVLMDMGSAVMNAELALELLPASMKGEIVLSSAPFVEGAVAAAAQASAGGNLEEVLREANSAIVGKQNMLGPVGEISAQTNMPPGVNSKGRLLKIIVPNKLGLHARPAAKLIKLLSDFRATVYVSKEGRRPVNAKSISQVSTLGTTKGDALIFLIQGEDGAGAEEAIKAFAADNFGDPVKGENDQQKPAKNKKRTINKSKGQLFGTPASPGIFVGKAFLARLNDPEVVEVPIEDPASEILLLRAAITNVEAEISQIQTQLNQGVAQTDDQILDFPLLLLEDHDLIHRIEAFIAVEQVNAAYAWSQAIEDLEARYRAMDSPYMQERAGDIRELRRKVLLALVGEEAYTFKISEPSILVVEELGPAEVAGLDTSLVRGIITRKGGVTSHAAILAKALGIPAIVGLGDQFTSIIDGAQLAMDGTSGRVLAVKEHPNEVAQLKEQQWQNEETQVQLMRQASAPATTSDGKTFPILANVKDANGAKKAFVMGADGIGLLRTEFLYMNRTTPPSEEEQYRSYSSICRAMQGKPVTIRTLDVGGDKPIPYLGIPLEKNPFLGLRGIRYCLHESGQHLFRTQLRAICRVAAEFPVRLMYPMIGVVEEVKAANKLLAEVLDVLRAADIWAVRPQAVGIMIEVPSTAFCIPALAREADFFSIGTNDLTQYLLTLDRGNEMVATYRSALHPSVLEALQQIITAAKVCQIEIGMCGELAGNPKVTELLIQMGLDKFSMNAPAIPVVKDIVRQLDYAALTKRKQSISLLDNLAAVETALSERD